MTIFLIDLYQSFEEDCFSHEIDKFLENKITTKALIRKK